MDASNTAARKKGCVNAAWQFPRGTVGPSIVRFLASVNLRHLDAMKGCESLEWPIFEFPRALNLRNVCRQSSFWHLGLFKVDARPLLINKNGKFTPKLQVLAFALHKS